MANKNIFPELFVVAHNAVIQVLKNCSTFVFAVDSTATDPIHFVPDPSKEEGFNPTIQASL